MASIPLSEIVNVSENLPIQKSFYGIGVGVDGIPIDLIRVHLLGNALQNYSILLADEFSSKKIAGDDGLNNTDLLYATQMYVDAFKTFNKIWRTDIPLIFSSDFMSSNEYHSTLEHIEQKIKEIGVEESLLLIKTERGKDNETRRKYTVNELAVIEFLRQREGINLKIGPASEQKYDTIMKKISPKMSFIYLYPAYTLSKSYDEPSPHLVDNIISIPNKRILVSDDPDTVEEKLKFGNRDALRYFAILGSLAGRAEGKTCKSSSDILTITDEKHLLDIAQIYILDNIISPFRRAKGISVYKKTPLRHFYDSTFSQVKYRLIERIPNLKEEVRPELDNLSNKLLYLLSERSREDFNPSFYNSKFPNLSDVGIHPSIIEDIYLPILNILCKKSGQKDLKNVKGLDLEIMNVIQRRILIGYDVAVAKLRIGKSVYDGEREQTILRRASETGHAYGLNPTDITKVFQLLIDKTRELENIVISRYEIDFHA